MAHFAIIFGMRELEAEWVDGGFSAVGAPFEALRDLVMREHVVVLLRVFPPDMLDGIREAVFAWGCENDPARPQTYDDRNFHAVESGISPRQRTPHDYHAYNFNRLSKLPTALRTMLTQIFDPMLAFQNCVTDNRAGLEFDASGRKARPQIIHYPSGGGMFGKHVHPLEPQRIGLILGLSKRGRDFETGATHFLVAGREISSEECHDQGDLLLFRFDIPHWITPVDPHKRAEETSPGGRWTAVLPFH